MVAAHHPPPYHLVPAPPARVARHSAVVRRPRIDRRAAAALVAELEHTTIEDLVRSTDAALPLSA